MLLSKGSAVGSDQINESALYNKKALRHGAQKRLSLNN
jgi:hypothetical protein